MNTSEFNEWKEDYFAAFPGTHQWLVEKSPNAKATLRVWAKTLHHIPLHVAAAVTDRMISGQLAPVAAYERDQTALHIRAYANRIIGDQRQREENAKHREQLNKRKRNAFPAGALYVECAEIAKEAAKRFPDDKDARAEWYDAESDRVMGEWIANGGEVPKVEYA
jgi:hypothetical protein